MKLHPAFGYYDGSVKDAEAISIFSSCWGSKEIMRKESILLENRIKEIKTTNVKSISVREYNKLNKELFTINKEIESIQKKLDACDIYFSNIEQGTLN